MNTDLEQRLREAGSTISMDRPVEDILDGGDRLRRRRSRAALAGAGAAATVVALGASVLMSPGSNPLVTPAVASWSGGQTNLTAEELTTLSDACLDGYAAMPADTVPAVAERRDDTILAYFRHGDSQLSCVAAQDEQGTIRPAGSSYDDVAPLPAGAHLDTRLLHTAAPVDGGPGTGFWSVHEVSAEVDRVSADIGGSTFEGTVLEDTALFWVAGTFTERQVDRAVFTAYDSTGRELARVDHLTDAGGPQGPNDDRDR